MNRAYLLIGGNLGNRESNLSKTCGYIEATCGNISNRSAVYETAPWGKTDQPGFLNQALLIYTKLDPAGLLEKILEIERLMGRMRTEKFGPRIMDIDILLFNQEVVDQDELVIPHPQMAGRRFVLVPLAEIAGDILHPVLCKPIRQLLAECTDPLAVDKKSGTV